MYLKLLFIIFNWIYTFSSGEPIYAILTWKSWNTAIYIGLLILALFALHSILTLFSILKASDVSVLLSTSVKRSTSAIEEIKLIKPESNDASY